MSNTYLEAKRIINGKSFNDVANLPSVDERFSYGSLNGREGEGLVDLNFKDILVTVRNENGVANIVNYEQYDENNQFDNLIYTNESKQKKVVKLNESQLRKIVAESVKKVLKEWEYNRNEGWFLYTEINNDGVEVLSISDNKEDFDYWRKNGGNSYGQYPSYEEAAKAMRYFAAKEGFKRANGCFVKQS